MAENNRETTQNENAETNEGENGQENNGSAQQEADAPNNTNAGINEGGNGQPHPVLDTPQGGELIISKLDTDIADTDDMIQSLRTTPSESDEEDLDFKNGCSLAFFEDERVNVPETSSQNSPAVADESINVPETSSQNVLIPVHGTHSGKITFPEQADENCGFPMQIVVKFGAGRRSQKSYYDTSRKHGLLCILQHDEPEWKSGNESDRKALYGFFKNTLNFTVKEYTHYSDLCKEVPQTPNLKQYYCLVICISGHGSELGIQIGRRQETIPEITKRFGNEKLRSLAGVPKIFFLDTCREGKTNRTIHKPKEELLGKDVRKVLPTTDSDCLIIHASTHGFKGFMGRNGSVGLQGVLNILRENWQNDHLEEILIDAREEVAIWDVEGKRQTLEIQTTLLKRLQFMKCV